MFHGKQLGKTYPVVSKAPLTPIWKLERPYPYGAALPAQAN
jgi:hypothetical protein